jgi:hypothetical protein
MRVLAQVLMVGLLALPAGGCAARNANVPDRTDRSIISKAQIDEHGFINAYDAVESLRSTWLRTRGTNSLNRPTEVLVYIDDNRLGGVQTLKQVTTSQIIQIRFVDGLTATARWGLDHGQGVILVVTHY